MRWIAPLVIALGQAGCASVPYDPLSIDSTSNFKTPSAGMAGINVYQWKTGILGAGMDVNFEIKGHTKIALNTGEYAYLELPPGNYEYKLMGGIFPTFLPVTFAAGHNYFFRAALLNFSDSSVLVSDQQAIDEAKQNIMSGRYELHDVD